MLRRTSVWDTALVLCGLFLLAPGSPLFSHPSFGQQPTGNGQADRAWTDALGHRLTLEAPPVRIVSLSPNLTEILFALGVGKERIAAVTRFCDYPPEVAQIPRIGGIVDPSVEAILAVDPDLVLATRGNPAPILDRLRATGRCVFALESQAGLEQVLKSMRTIAGIVSPDDPAKADSAIVAFDSQLSYLREVSGSIPDSVRPLVYYYDAVSPDWTAGAGTHIDELISLGGGRNLAADAPTAWPRYALEQILKRQPDWLLVALPEREGDEDAIRRRLSEQAGWRSLHAVREGRICLASADWLMRPGPRVLRAVRVLGECLHPGRAWWGEGP
jgi:iron complex transport system substrate-binding protein